MADYIAEVEVSVAVVQNEEVLIGEELSNGRGAWVVRFSGRSRPTFVAAVTYFPNVSLVGSGYLDQRQQPSN